MKKFPIFAIALFSFGIVSANSGDIRLQDFSESVGVGINMRQGKGHNKNREAVASGDTLGFLRGFGYTGSSFPADAGVGIDFEAAEAWTATANGTEIAIKTTAVGATTAREVGTFESDGGFLPFSRTEAQLKVSTPTAVGAIYYDSTNKEFVQSTGTTTCADYSKIEDPAAAPDGW